MQLSGPALRRRLALATSGLLCTGPPGVQAQWDVDAAVLVYSEGAERVSA